MANPSWLNVFPWGQSEKEQAITKAEAEALVAAGGSSSSGSPLSGSKGSRWRRGGSRWLNEATPVAIECNGDSTTFGEVSGTNLKYLYSWPALLQKKVRNWLGGDELEIIFASDSDDPRIETSGVWAKVAQGPMGQAYKTVATGATWTFGTATYKFLSRYLVLYWIGNPEGKSLTWSIDGAGFVGGSSTTVAEPKEIQRTVIDMGSYAPHTFTVKSEGSSKPLTLVGVGVLRTASLATEAEARRVIRDGVSGKQISDTILNGSLTGFESGKGLAPLTSNFQMCAVGTGRSGLLGGPDLTILGFTINDYLQAVPLATYKERLKIKIAKGEELGSDFLCLAMPEPNESPVSGTLKYQEYVAALKTVATEENCGFLDLSLIWGVAGSTLWGEMMTGTLHPSRKGHAEIADRVFEAIYYPIGVSFPDRLKQALVTLSGATTTTFWLANLTAASRLTLTRKTQGTLAGHLSYAITEIVAPGGLGDPRGLVTVTSSSATDTGEVLAKVEG